MQSGLQSPITTCSSSSSSTSSHRRPIKSPTTNHHQERGKKHHQQQQQQQQRHIAASTCSELIDSKDANSDAAAADVVTVKFDVINYYPNTTVNEESSTSSSSSATTSPPHTPSGTSSASGGAPRAIVRPLIHPQPQMVPPSKKRAGRVISGASLIEPLIGFDESQRKSTDLIASCCNSIINDKNCDKKNITTSIGTSTGTVASVATQTSSSSSSSSSLLSPSPSVSPTSPSSTQATAPTSAPSSTLGVNMRVTGQCSQGGRKYMEDQFSVAYQESPVTRELEYAFFGIYDGHGGTEAALFAKEHLMLEIVKQKLFWSDNDEDVLRAIREGYIATHFAMWRIQEKWPRTANGHLSTAGTTATVAFMRREKIYIGHVGDSGIVLGYQNEHETTWRAKQLTTDHKPESVAEKTRIQRAGGNVTIKSGVPRVVWNRPRDPYHRGPIRHRTPVDDIPFLAVARSLGDLWSYNSRYNEFVVSPDPDVKVVKINPHTFKCLIFGTDGLWNVITPQEAVDIVRGKHTMGECLSDQNSLNPSKGLVDKALKTWGAKKMRADNTSVVTVILSPAVPPPSSPPSPPPPPPSSAITHTHSVSSYHTTINSTSSATAITSSDVEEIESSLHIEEYEHCIPYSALAKRYQPPEAYRNFDYYDDEDDEHGGGGCGDGGVDEDEVESEDDSISRCYTAEERARMWRKSRQELCCDETPSWAILDNDTIIVDAPSLLPDRYLTNPMSSMERMGDLIRACREDSESEEDEEEEEEEEVEEEDSILTGDVDVDVHVDVDVGAGGDAENTSTDMEIYTDLTLEDDSYLGSTGPAPSLTSVPPQDTDSRELAELEQHLEHSYGSYVANASTATDYSFAESYNSLLNEQQATARTARSVTPPSPPATHLPSNTRSMQEILQEQQRYQQQEGYSLTRLETRREQQQQQLQSVAWPHPAAPAADYVSICEAATGPPPGQDPAELLELDALLQQERAEEQQVALEQQQKHQQQQQQQQQQEQQLLVTTEWTAMDVDCTDRSPADTADADAETEAEAVAVVKMQDNEVTSTLLPRKPTAIATPRTPTEEQQQQKQQQEKGIVLTSVVQQFQNAVSEIRKEDTHTVNYIFQQIQKLQVECTPVVAMPTVGEAIERVVAAVSAGSINIIKGTTKATTTATPTPTPKPAAAAATTTQESTTFYRMRQMRRYRNVPNENRQQHLPTRCHGVRKHSKTRSYITANASSASVAGTVVAVTNNNNSNSNNNSSINNRNSSRGNDTGNASMTTIATRRSQSAAVVGQNVSKRQLRSTICNLDITKRTLRTRNATSTPIVGHSGGGGGGGSSGAAGSGGGSGGGVSSSSNTFPATGTTTVTVTGTATKTRTRGVGVGLNEQRRSLRRSTLMASGGGGIGGASVTTLNSTGGTTTFSKPTRLPSSGSGGISARPPPSPKKLVVVPTLAIGSRTTPDCMSKRWTLRSAAAQLSASVTDDHHHHHRHHHHQQQQQQQHHHHINGTQSNTSTTTTTTNNNNSNNNNNNSSATSSLMSAMRCYGSRTRPTNRRR